MRRNSVIAWFCLLLAIGLTEAGCSSGPPRSALPLLPQSKLGNGLQPLRAAVSGTTVFIADLPLSTVLEYPAGVDNPKPIERITKGIVQPISIATDGAGTLYVANLGYGETPHPTVTEYASGSTSPSVTIALGKVTPDAIAVGPDGTLYVVATRGFVDEYYKGATEPSLKLPNPGKPSPYGLGEGVVDANNNFYVSFFGGSCCGDGVVVYPPKSTDHSYLAGAKVAGSLAFDNNGAMLIGSVFKPYGIFDVNNGTQTKYSGALAGYMGFDPADSLLYISYGTVSIIDYATKKTVGHIAGIYDASGIAVSPNPF